MADKPLFDPAHCPTPFVPLEDFTFIDDCLIPPAPPPIADCPDVELTYDPPIQEPSCPTIVINTSAKASIGGTYCDDPEFRITVDTAPDNSCGSCRVVQNWDLELVIPPPKIPCPDIRTSAAGSVRYGKDHCAPATFDVSVVGEQSYRSCGSCTLEQSWDFDIVIPPPKIPCPDIRTSATGSVRYGADHCAPATFDIAVVSAPSYHSCGSCTLEQSWDFDIVIPPPKIPCPDIRTSATGSIRYGSDVCAPATFDVSVVTTPSYHSCGSCTLEQVWDFDVAIPPPKIPCPDIRPTVTGSIRYGDDPCEAPSFRAEIVSTPSYRSCGSCTLEQAWDFDIRIPPPKIPCPNITADGTVNVNEGGPPVTCESDPGVVVAVEVTPGDSCSNACTVDFAFDFRIPPPVLPCPEVYAAASGSLQISGVVYYMDSSSLASSCADKPDMLVTVETSVRNIGTSCSPQCVVDFDFDFDLTIPPPLIPAPVFTVSPTGSIQLQAEDDDPYVSITADITKISEGTRCQPGFGYAMSFDFEFGIPVGGGAPIMHFSIDDAGCEDGRWAVTPLFFGGSCETIPGGDEDGYKVKPFCESPFTEAELTDSGKGVAIYTYDMSTCTRRWVEITHCAVTGC